MSNGVTWAVREARIQDAAALSVVAVATFLETFAGVLDGSAIVAHCHMNNSTDAYAAYLRSESRAWIAEIAPGGAPAGFALMTTPELPSATDGDLELKRIYTLSRFHGMGVGAALMDSVLAAATGAKRLLLGVYAGNHRAIAFYRKSGFDQIATRKFDVGGTLYDDIVFARSLAS